MLISRGIIWDGIYQIEKLAMQTSITSMFISSSMILLKNTSRNEFYRN